MYLVFDIGGTSMRMAKSTNLRDFGKPVICQTPKDFETGMETFYYHADKLTKGKRIKAMAGGIAGPLSRDNSRLVNSPNLPKWIGKPLAPELARVFRTRVFLENDSAMVGLGEAMAGAGKGFSIVAYITISTGIGGVKISNGAIDENCSGFEPGQQIIDMHSKLTWEKQASGKALCNKYGMSAEKISDPRVWKKEIEYIARGLNNISVMWSPDVIVLGGGVMKSKHLAISKIEKELKKVLKIFPKIPKLKRAQLKDVGGLYGALTLIRRK